MFTSENLRIVSWVHLTMFSSRKCPYPPLWKFQLSLLHFYQCFGLREPPPPRKPIPSAGGLWIFSNKVSYPTPNSFTCPFLRNAWSPRAEKVSAHTILCSSPFFPSSTLWRKAQGPKTENTSVLTISFRKKPSFISAHPRLHNVWSLGKKACP